MTTFNSDLLQYSQLAQTVHKMDDPVLSQVVAPAIAHLVGLIEMLRSANDDMLMELTEARRMCEAAQEQLTQMERKSDGVIDQLREVLNREYHNRDYSFRRPY